MAEKSKILVIGGTGYIGKFIVEASAKAGHPTFALVRETTVSDPDKAKLIDSFKASGVTLVQVSILQHKRQKTHNNNNIAFEFLSLRN